MKYFGGVFLQKNQSSLVGREGKPGLYPELAFFFFSSVLRGGLGGNYFFD